MESLLWLGVLGGFIWWVDLIVRATRHVRSRRAAARIQESADNARWGEPVPGHRFGLLRTLREEGRLL